MQILKEATTNKFGDLICPNCSANIITPEGYKLKDGIGQCGVCGEGFTMTSKKVPKYCPECGNKLGYATGIGLVCGDVDCPVIDGVLSYIHSYISEEYILKSVADKKVAEAKKEGISLHAKESEDIILRHLNAYRELASRCAKQKHDVTKHIRQVHEKYRDKEKGSYLEFSDLWQAIKKTVQGGE